MLAVNHKLTCSDLCCEEPIGAEALTHAKKTIAQLTIIFIFGLKLED
ncbi:hypothetical protein SC206_06070 [Rouxiella sp. T17]